MSFYRTYRPQIISEIDNLAVRESLMRLLSKPKKELPHAFLFSGPRGAGKTTAARLIAKLFNCTKSGSNGPCGSCNQCNDIAKGTNLDVLELDAASNRGIDEIRQIRDAIGLSPVSAEYRVYIIDEVHMLTTEAFNALLKTLEEPPPHAVFVLATTDPQKVPVTIQSRCVPIVFQRASPQELIVALKRIVTKEKMTVDDAALELIASHVDGSFRDAVKQLELVSFTTGSISTDSVRTSMSIGDLSVRDTFLSYVQQKKTTDALEIITAVISGGRDTKLFIMDCLSKLEELLITQVTGKTSTSGWSIQQLTSIIRIFSKAFVDTKSAAIAHLPLELAVIEYCELGGDTVHQVDIQSVQKENSSVVMPINVAAHKPRASSHAESVAVTTQVSTGALSVEKLTEHWPDIIMELKKHNHSVSGVMRSTRPKSVVGDIVTVEAFFPFHKEKLSESKTRDLLNGVFYALFGEKVKVEIVLGKK